MEEVGCEDVGQIQMAQDTVQLQDLVKMTITYHILWVRNFVTIFKDMLCVLKLKHRETYKLPFLNAVDNNS